MMAALAMVLVFVAAAAVHHWAINTGWGRRRMNPVSMALTSTAVSALCVIAGFAGYILNRHERFVAGTAWAGSIVWSQVWAGIAIAVVAGFFWRAALREVTRRTASVSRSDGARPQSARR